MLPRFSSVNPVAVKKRVLYEDTSVIYEGMPVCYNYDSTTNVDGYDNTDGAGTTTDEGHQSEGKFTRVTDPEDNALMHFAGVVAGSDLNGVTGDGNQWLDIYIPNGAVVPVRCDVDTTTGITLLAITVDSQEFGQPVEGTSRVVALAMETETALDGTADITLARLDNNMSIYQDLDGTALSVGAGTANHVANSINVTSAQTSGRFTALHVKSTLTAGGGSAHYGAAIYAHTVVSVQPATPQLASVSVRLEVTGGTMTQYLTALKATVKETGATMTGVYNVSVLNLALQITNECTANSIAWVYLEDNSTQPADFLLRANSWSDFPAVRATAATTDTAGIDLAIPIYAENDPTGTKTYYLRAYADDQVT